MIEFLVERLIGRIIRHGDLEVIFPCGRRIQFGDASGGQVRVLIADRGALWRLALRPTFAFGELITDNRLRVVCGSVYELVELVARNIGTGVPAGILPFLTLQLKCASWLQRRNTVWRAKRNVAHHYDLDGRLYRLFLDADQQYSCAYFDGHDNALEEAQLSKKRHIAAKLLPTANQRVLDIGSGWGGMALYLAKCCRLYVTGITLSTEQLEVARRRVRDQGLDGQVEFRLEDYRNVKGEFDRIVSVGMFEHVGPHDYDNFFAHSRNILSDDGIMLLHTIGRLDGPSPTNPWLEKYIFPGGYAPALSEVMPSIERSGFVITDVEVLRVHYAQTLRAWRQRFAAHWDEAAKLYDERFCRMWEFYLAACEASFRFGGLVVFQLQLAKRVDAVPLTRSYIEQREALLREAEKQAQIGLAEAAE